MSPVDLTRGRPKEAPRDPEKTPFVIMPAGCHVEAHHLEGLGADGESVQVDMCSVRFITVMGDISVALPWEAWDQLAKGVIRIVADRASKTKHLEVPGA